MTTYDISIKNLNVKFIDKLRTVKAVNNVTVDFKFGKITGIVGESGSGKSVLGMSILQLLPQSAVVTGKCIYENNNLYELDKKEIRDLRCKEIGLIVQNPSESLNPVLTVGNQLLEPLVKRLSKNKKEAREIVIEYLEKFGFEKPETIIGKYPFQLSGGMNQRIISIMGLICNPKWIIADEPTKGLDSILRKNIYNVFLKIKNDFTGSMIIITHDLYFAKKICDRIVVMYKGEIVEIGKSKDILENPRHPYTKGLIKASPSNGMIPIPENVNKINSSGCKFYDRCIESNRNCVNNAVKLEKIDEFSMVRCLLYDKYQ